MEVSKLDVKHRVVLPTAIRQALGLAPGDQYRFEIVDGEAFLRKVEAKGRGAN